MEWQDISTAPQDGRWFITANFNAEDGEYEICRFEPLTYRRFNERPDGLFEAEDHTVIEWESDNFHRATHWADIPAAPTMQELE